MAQAITEKEIGLRIGAYMKEKGVKQRYIVKKAGFTDANFSRMINGYQGMSVIQYAKICKALEVDFSTFLDGITLEG